MQLTLTRSPGWDQTVQAVVLSNKATDPLSDRQAIVYHPGGPGFSVVRRATSAPPSFDPDRFVVIAWDGNTAGDTPGPCGPASVTYLTERRPADFAGLARQAGSACRLGFGSAADVGAWAAAEELEAVRSPFAPEIMVRGSSALSALGPICVTRVLGHTSSSDPAVRDLVDEFIARESAESISEECAALPAP